MKKIYLFFGATFFIFFLYVILSVYLIEKRQFGYAEIWLENLYKVKDYINTLPTDKQRLLVFSGSNSLFGFNGAMVDSQTRFHFINYGTHGAIPLNFHVDKIISVTKENDIIFLPLEYTYYSNKEPRRSYWYIHNMLAWGNEYNKYIDKYSILLSYFKMPPQAALQKFLYALRLKEDQDSIESIKQIWKQPNIQDFSYNYKTLNQHGDFCIQQGEIKNINEGYLTKDMRVSTFFLQEYQRLQEFAKTKKIKIFLTYPVSAENPSFSLEDKETFEKIRNLNDQLQQHHIKIYGDFKDFHLDKKYFFDSYYHLNAEGAKIHTQKFIDLLETMDKNNDFQ